MDLAALDNSTIQEDGADLDVKHPATGDPIGLRIRVASFKSKRVDKVSKRIMNDRLRNTRKKPTAERFERDAMDTCVAAVVSWRFDEGVTLDGEQPEANAQTVEKLFTRLPWVREQVDEFASDMSNYLSAA